MSWLMSNLGRLLAANQSPRTLDGETDGDLEGLAEGPFVGL